MSHPAPQGRWPLRLLAVMLLMLLGLAYLYLKDPTLLDLMLAPMLSLVRGSMPLLCR